MLSQFSERQRVWLAHLDRWPALWKCRSYLHCLGQHYQRFIILRRVISCVVGCNHGFDRWTHGFGDGSCGANAFDFGVSHDSTHFYAATTVCNVYQIQAITCRLSIDIRFVAVSDSSQHLDSYRQFVLTRHVAIHVVALDERSPGTSKLYINGLPGPTKSSLSLSTKLTNAYINRRGNGAAGGLNTVKIARWRVYNRLLSDVSTRQLPLSSVSSLP